MKKLKGILLFAIGGGAYVGLELLYRGYSHPSMFLAGGLCFLLLGKLRILPPLTGAMAGAATITAVELTAGLLVNRDYSVWDYRDRWGNFLGQICPAFILLWIPVALGGILLYQWTGDLLDRFLRLRPEKT